MIKGQKVKEITAIYFWKYFRLLLMEETGNLWLTVIHCQFSKKLFVDFIR